MVEFRWAVLIALWTMFIGPVLDLGSQHSSRAHSRPTQARPATTR
jgi:hypothetical protein